MLKKYISILMTLALLLSAIALVPAAMAEEYTAKTTLSGASKGKLNNIKLAGKAIDGVRVDAGASFSFNKVVGARTKKRGYVSAVNGRGSKVVGGGVSQVAATLYLALKQLGDDIAFGDLMFYGSRFKDNYLPNGKDAIVTDYKAGHDLAFRNKSDAFTISMWSDGDNLYCTLTTDDEGDRDGREYNDGDGEGDDWFADWGAEETFRATTMPVASASIPCTGGDACAANAALAAGSIYDTTLYSGDVFSFNGIVGPRKESYGYVTALNGRGVKVVGGGCAQVASVVWLAVRNMDDVAIVEKSTYGNRYSQDYVASSADAIVVDYSAGTDFSFRYTGSGSITLYTYLEDGMLFCDIHRN